MQSLPAGRLRPLRYSVTHPLAIRASPLSRPNPALDDASLLRSYRDKALTALAASDYDTAERSAIAAQAVAGMMPDLNRSAGAGGSQSVNWSREAIDTFITRIRQLKSASVGVQVQNVEYLSADPGLQNAILGDV